MNEKTSGETPKKDAAKSKRKKPARAETDMPEDAPEFNSVIHPEDEGLGIARKGISRASAVMLAIVSAIAGGAIGWVGPMMFKGTDQTAGFRANLNTAIAAVQTKIATHDKSLKDLNGASTQKQERIQRLEKAEQDLLTQQDNLSAQIEALIAQDAQNVPTPKTLEQQSRLSDRLDILEASAANGTETSVGSLAILERFSALEEMQNDLAKQFSDLKQQQVQNSGATPSFPQVNADPIHLPSMETSDAKTQALLVLRSTFPRQAMLETVRAQNILAAKKPSWLQRTLSKHVKMQDTNSQNPLDIITAAQAALDSGDIQTSLDEIAKLNPPVRAAASDWVSAAKKAAKSLADTGN